MTADPRDTTTPAPTPDASPFPPLPRFQVKPGEFYGKPAEWVPINVQEALEAILARRTALYEPWPYNWHNVDLATRIRTAIHD